VADSCGQDGKRKKKKKARVQGYRDEWEQDDRFKSWISRAANDDKALCKACGVSMNSKSSTLVRHVNSDTHKGVVKSYTGRSTLSRFLTKPIDESTKKAELLLCAAFAEHNIPFRFMDHLSSIVKSAFPDSRIAQNFAMKRSKCAALT